MTPQKLEELLIRSLDVPLNEADQLELVKALESDPLIAKRLEQHRIIRETLKRKEPATFGPYFTAKLIHRIQNTGVVVDHQLFVFFKKFQLAAIGVVVALLVANMIFSEQKNLPTILGIEQPTSTDEVIVSFDYSQSLTQ
jgi:hypothetical protein